MLQIREGLEPIMEEIRRLRVRLSVVNLGEAASLILSEGPREKSKSAVSSPSPTTSANTSPLRTTNQTDVSYSSKSKDTKNKGFTPPWKRPEGESLKLFQSLRKCRHELAHEPKRHREDDDTNYIVDNMNLNFDGQEFFKRKKKDAVINEVR
ncbi:hypothetical protein V9T40_011859 [Parthenolecanium corni]|uniref:Uncharacterized protein n=1 Tax=Parthenolecanium corni TaxID=536013 RepID=A0AAN9TA39_9HEMI